MQSDVGLKPLSSRVLYGYADYVYSEILLKGNHSEDTIGDYFSDVDKLAKPHRCTLLHDFIITEVEWIVGHMIRKIGSECSEQLEELLEEALMDVPRWLSRGAFDGHDGQLSKLVKEAVQRIAPSIFYILFSDRYFLLAFQTRASEVVLNLKRNEHPHALRADGILKRAHIPTWLRKGVFYRDRGRCQLCFKDLSGILRPNIDIQLDHIIPLASGGSNDPTNFQLLCEKCNSGKQAKRINGRPMFTPFW